ncbi:hypothetical protein KFK14_12900 [Sphingobium phenoxybenzoativorans]|uniref:Uncharacterized protein n=1 Tax=Sphingobium phenoxybenzoativorans TaxID=1592790 RepID=A0A975PZK6_9SPHN|nr:hypothetical protein [Sphingobium phenoxybenzoativorans]QUT04045.1 hypothetical protein KFK14_12900 [Sphingobium phenoxybenzoativorans]
MVVNRNSFKRESDQRVTERIEDLSAPGSVMEWFQRGDVTVHLAGTATAFDGVVERATRDPNKPNPNWALAQVEHITGNLTTGVPFMVFQEPSKAWWRFRLISITGGNITVSLAGEQA